MKREILCPPCAKRTSGQITGLKFIDHVILDPYPGEYKKFQEGKVSRFRSLVCDQCGIKLKEGQEAVALSIWSRYGGIQYYPWEGEYLDTNTN